MPTRNTNTDAKHDISIPPRLASDEAFPLFQFSGLIEAGLNDKAQAHKIAALMRSFPADKNWSKTAYSYAEIRKLLELIWFSGKRDELLLAHCERITRRSFGTIGISSFRFGTREEAIVFCAKNLHTVWTAKTAKNPDGSITMLHTPRFYDPELRGVLELFHFANCVSFSRLRGGHHPIADRIGFTGAAGIGRESLESFFRCPVAIGVDVGFIDFSATAVAQPLGRLENDDFEQAPGLSISCKAHGFETLFQVFWQHREQIRSAADFAEKLGLSHRSLNRLLASEGTSYPELSKGVRSRQARLMLRAGLSTPEIAERLNFSDERSFRRAFQTWSGTSLREYRRYLAANG